MDGTNHDAAPHAEDHPGYGTFLKVWAALVGLTGLLVLMSRFGQNYAVWGLLTITPSRPGSSSTSSCTSGTKARC